MNIYAQSASKAAKVASKVIGKIGAGVAGAAAMKYFDKDKDEDETLKSQFVKKQCPTCMGNCGYYDFYGYYHLCPRCQGKGVIIETQFVSFTGNTSKYSNRETCGARNCRCRVQRKWLDDNNLNYCPECHHPTGWHH